MNTSPKTSGTLVLVRHGQSEFNAKNAFAGWVDTPLTPLGIDQAIAAGKALYKAGFQPDAVYASPLVRAVETDRKITEALGQMGRTIIQKRELMERHYGALTGMNKKEAERHFGEALFKQYRRSYDMPPPPMDASHAFHPDHPSAGDKVIALPDNGQGTESLAHVVERVRPLWQQELLPLLALGKSVLIAAHGNSLRALSMIIEHMTPEQVADFELKNAEPVLFTIEVTGADWKVLGKKAIA